MHQGHTLWPELEEVQATLTLFKFLCQEHPLQQELEEVVQAMPTVLKLLA